MLLWMMKSPSECIAPFDEERQTGSVQTVPVGGVVAVGVAVAVGDAVGVRVGVAVAVVVGDAVGVRVGVAVAVGDTVAEWLGVAVVAVGVAVAVRVGVAVVAVGVTVGVVADADGVADVVGGFVTEGDALMVLGGGVVAPSLSTVKVARRMEVPRCDHVRTAVIACRPSTSFSVSKGRADPSLAVPAKSKGGTNSVRTGSLDFQESSR